MNFTKETMKILENTSFNAKILVVGDVMLDKYWFGNVERISPEAPVPVAKIYKVEYRPGGAANVARNIASLGGNVTLLSVVGKDEASVELENLLKKEKLNTIFKYDSTINTIVKLRVLARNQQLIRIDFEKSPSHEILSEILEDYKSLISDYDAIILSDYGKGGLTHIIEMVRLANEQNKILLIDPKGDNYSKYKGATIITPNRQELREVIGSWANENELNDKVFKLIHQLNISNILLTRSEEGMTLYTKNSYKHFDTTSKEVYDVSGAGDTVIATLGLMLANKINLTEATKLSNLAAGIVVGKLGTATISKDELLNELSNFLI